MTVRGTPQLLGEAEREPALVQLVASSLSAEAQVSKRARLMLARELGRRTGGGEAIRPRMPVLA